MEVAPEGRNVGPACPCKRVVNEEVVQDRVPELNKVAFGLFLSSGAVSSKRLASS